MRNSHRCSLFTFSILFFLFANTSFCQEANPTVNQDEKIPVLLELKKDLQKENKLTSGFTIQLFYGEFSKAEEVFKEYEKSYDNWPASIEYETPNYKVWVGNFNSRRKADSALLQIKEEFPTAFILKPDRNQ